MPPLFLVYSHPFLVLAAGVRLPGHTEASLATRPPHTFQNVEKQLFCTTRPPSPPRTDGNIVPTHVRRLRDHSPGKRLSQSLLLTTSSGRPPPSSSRRLSLPHLPQTPPPTVVLQPRNSRPTAFREQYYQGVRVVKTHNLCSLFTVTPSSYATSVPRMPPLFLVYSHPFLVYRRYDVFCFRTGTATTRSDHDDHDDDGISSFSGLLIHEQCWQWNKRHGIFRGGESN